MQTLEVPPEVPVSPPPPGNVQTFPPPPPATDRPGAPAINGSADLLSKIEHAANDAIEQHFEETKRGPGKRGPDKKPRRPRIPVAPVVPGADPSSLAPGAPVPLLGFLPIEPSFDESTATALVEIAVGLLNDGAAAVVAAVAKKETGDSALADAAGAAVRMSEKIEAAIRRGGVECARKYAVRMDYAPEMMLFGGLIIWSGQISLSIRALKAQGAALKAGGGSPAP